MPPHLILEKFLMEKLDEEVACAENSIQLSLKLIIKSKDLSTSLMEKICSPCLAESKPDIASQYIRDFLFAKIIDGGQNLDC